MNWKALFTFSDNLSAADVQAHMKRHASGTYQLIDVRQVSEYEREHLPGAILIPLKELVARIGKLDRKKTTFVYCSIGIRSKAACQLLLGHGFTRVFNVAGGIRAWKGMRLSGTEIKGMEFFVSRDFESAFQMAYMMEEGLKQFYLAMADKVDDPDQKDLLTCMASFEDGHMAKLKHQYRQTCSVPDMAENISVMEGGFDREKTLEAYGDYIGSMEDIIQLGMMFETQAYDLYSRLARKEKDEETLAFYRHMANEEKKHLNQLSRELDKILAGLSMGPGMGTA